MRPQFVCSLEYVGMKTKTKKNDREKTKHLICIYQTNIITVIMCQAAIKIFLVVFFGMHTHTHTLSIKARLQRATAQAIGIILAHCPTRSCNAVFHMTRAPHITKENDKNYFCFVQPPRIIVKIILAEEGSTLDSFSSHPTKEDWVNNTATFPLNNEKEVLGTKKNRCELLWVVIRQKKSQT